MSSGAGVQKAHGLEQQLKFALEPKSGFLLSEIRNPVIVVKKRSLKKAKSGLEADGMKPPKREDMIPPAFSTCNLKKIQENHE